MSLRIRLLAAIFLALLISFSLGAGLAAWSAARGVHHELTAALNNARRGTMAALADMKPGPQDETELRRMVSAYDGSLHIRATLVGTRGAELAASQPAAMRPPPAWFLRLLAPALPPVVAPISGAPGIAALRLEADPVSEAAERWSELRLRVASFAIFFALAAGLCSLTVARSLRPLTELAHALARLGRGEVPQVMPEAGPPEIATVSRAFNAMAADLRGAEAQNQRLQRQILTIAEEERAEIARDLHDEIGPLLFAITAFTAAIGRQVQTGDLAQVPAQLEQIQQATARLQRTVREMLGRLHETAPAPADLPAALADLASFWRAIRPETIFQVELSLGEAPGEAPLPAAVRECLFRGAQEAISNAVRHGRAGCVTISAAREPGAVMLVVKDDGAGGPTVDTGGAGLGLPGMRARAAALGGSVEISREGGWRVALQLPVAAIAKAAA